MYLPIGLAQLATLNSPCRVRIIGQLDLLGHRLHSVTGSVALLGLELGLISPALQGVPVEVWGLFGSEAAPEALTIHGLQTLRERGPQALHDLMQAQSPTHNVPLPSTG